MTRPWPFTEDACLNIFLAWLHEQEAPRVVEVGAALNSRGDWLPEDATLLRVDIADGPGVDLVADAHELSRRVSGYDALICTSTLEHLRRPWVAVDEFAKVLRPGGRALAHTHQTFPLHYYPHDYFRFSTEALCVLFDESAWETIAVEYNSPATIVAHPYPPGWSHDAEAWLNVSGCFERR